MKKKEHNYAFIDGQNLYLGMQLLDWEFDYRRFRVYLQEKYSIARAFIFIEYLSREEKLYAYLRDCGFELIFKEVAKDSEGNPKGNVDVDLTLHSLLKKEEYEKAVLVTSDGDFAPLVEHLLSVGKLNAVLSPEYKLCSWLLRKYAKGRVRYLNNNKHKLSKKKRRS